MSAAALNILFSLAVLAGLVFIVSGLRMERAGHTASSELDVLEPEIILSFSDLEPLKDIREKEEKQPFEPGKHQPERIEALKKL